MTTLNQTRIRKVNDLPIQNQGQYVLYWSQMSRRLTHNHALDYAIVCAKSLKKPLVVYEALKRNYPWASARIHQFVLEGMRENLEFAREIGINYWPFVETPAHTGRGLVRTLLDNACLLVTDDYPAYIVPAQIRAIAAVASCPVYAVDANGIIPLSMLGAPVAAAAHLRPRIHKLFADGWKHRAQAEPDFPKGHIDPPFELWKAPPSSDAIAEFVKTLSIDASVPRVKTVGGRSAGRNCLKSFIKERLPRYGQERNHPDDPARGSASGLSPYLHFGHVGIQEVCEAVLGKSWTEAELNLKTRNKDDFFCRDASINSFLDEALTWRDIGFHWHYRRNEAIPTSPAAVSKRSWQDQAERPSFNFETMDFSPRQAGKGTLQSVLPAWAWKTLSDHAGDRREYLYTLEQFEQADTHDPLWNAAQTELVHTGRMHNYLRMLWGKKVLEWTESPEQAYGILEHLNNKYALDGRDPNSYTGILWCFGLFDRPWPPERTVFGNIRFMSSDNTAKKFKLGGYYEYVAKVSKSSV
ncbi:MAG: deoxyribodipyrimidine photolyase [Gemmataceae bacterium]